MAERREVQEAAQDRRVFLLGCGIDALTLGETVGEVDNIVRARRPVQHCAINASKVVLMHKQPSLMAIVRSCALVNADGQSVVWASRFLGQTLPERVAGVDLFQALLRLAADRGYSVYFMGATREVLHATVARACREHPTLRVAGARDGYWTEGDHEVVQQVRDAEPAILFVAMPSPRKEYWLAEHLDRMRVPFAMGVGGSFDVYAGHVQRAPKWMQRAGLEWAFRFLQEPGRMWKRYLLGNLAFVALVLKYRSRRKPATDAAGASQWRGPHAS